jgi:ATP-dependent helicase IRC3
MVVALPTGSGKTVIFSELARMAKRPVLVLAHRSELVQQAADKLGRALGDPRAVAVEQGDLRAAAGVRAVVASIRSLHTRRLERVREGRDFGLVIYDECHHAAADDNKRVLEGLGCFDPDWGGTLLGFTATPTRADGIGLDEVFEEIAYSRSLSEMVDDGFLARLRGFRVTTVADLQAVRPAGRDLDVEALSTAVDVEERNALVARSIQELARDRRTIAFCVTISHATNLARSLNAIGVVAGVIHGNLRPEDRARVLAEFRGERLQVLTNVGVLTEGFDDPGVSCIAMARPTRSEGLYAQCIGRGTRLHPGKEDCLILDFVDLSDLSLVCLPSLMGMPKDLDLEGADVAEARETMRQLYFDYPGFELEAGAITLGEIQERAAAFDPLSMEVNPEILAISGNRWETLGPAGLALHFFRSRKSAGEGRLSVVELLARGRGKDKWHVVIDGRKVAGFSRIEAAVEATDFEIHRMGAVARVTALPEADWREEAVPPPLIAQLADLRRPRRAADWGEAVRLLGFESHASRRTGRGRRR